jgi:hypothetical protein
MFDFFQTLVIYGPSGSVSDFWKFYKAELALAPQTSIHP